MKFSLIVRTPGKMEGKAIAITLSQFLIGRDKQCQLRPASPLVSNRHCALQVRGERAFVRDFESTNGTFVNDQPVTGERELDDGDTLRLGPMLFEIRLQKTEPASKPAPAPAAETADDDTMAALLLSLPESDDPSSGIRGVDSQGVPTGSTVMDLPVPAGVEEGMPAESASPDKQTPAKTGSGDTAAAADALLQKYRRRGR
jgi:predicted component of type VI protein secretion system